MKMKLIALAVASLAVSGCANNIVVMQPTTQQHDLRDWDRDGVIEAREQCQASVAGSQVNNVGCGEEKNYKQKHELDIHFANNSAIIPQNSLGQIKEIADILKQNPNQHIVIEGHCSKTGSRALNLALSERRAEAVMQVLAQDFAISPNRMQAIGYGFDRPIDISGTEEGRERNRRVVAVINNQHQAIDMKWDIYTIDQK
ncbi:OmpA family protein [Photobacterium damselae]